MLVTLFTFAAKQHFDSREAASTRLSIATVAQQFVLADENLRDERGAVDAARRSDGPIGASDMDQLARFHGRSRMALATAAALLKADNIAMAVRYQAGLDRALLADAMTRAAPLGEKDHIQFAEFKVAAASPWGVILGAAKNPSFPPALRKAIQHAQKIYFTEQTAQ